MPVLAGWSKIARFSAHRGQVAQIHGNGLPARVVLARCGQVEVHTDDERVGVDRLERARIGTPDRRVVAVPDDEVGGRFYSWRAQDSREPIDRAEVSEIRDSHRRRLTTTRRQWVDPPRSQELVAGCIA